MMMNYATDGRCHNAQAGTFGHECGKPAVWVGTRADGFQCGFCDDCRQRGHEARAYVSWRPFAAIELTPAGEQLVIPGCERKHVSGPDNRPGAARKPRQGTLWD